MAGSSHVFCILSSLSQAEAPHDPHSVGREAEARTHFGQLVGLLVDTRRSHPRTARWLRREPPMPPPTMATRSRSALIDYYAEGSSTKGTFATSTGGPPSPSGTTVRSCRAPRRAPPTQGSRPRSWRPPESPFYDLRAAVSQGAAGLPAAVSARGAASLPSTAEPRNAIARNNTFITALTMYRSMDLTQ